MTVQNRLFVYGTLGPGRPNAHILEGIGGHWSTGFVYGKLVEAGWGAKSGFPALVIDDSGDKIDGFLFQSDSLAENWPMLDAFEGGEYERVSVQVHIAGGELTAQVYSLKS